MVTVRRTDEPMERRTDEPMEWSLPALLDIVCDAAPDREMLVWTDVRRSYREVAERTQKLAAFLIAHGIGIHHERHELERWECGQSPVALILHNGPEYIESMIGCFRARAVPVNINQHYTAGEIRSVLAMVGAEAVIYHRSLGPLVGEVMSDDIRLMIQVEDGSEESGVPDHVRYEEAVAHAPESLPVASPDDLYLVCTGGTTGLPKAVLWRQADVYVSSMGGHNTGTAEQIAATARTGFGTWFAPPPLMHAAAQWTVFAGLLGGATVVLHDDRKRFDAAAIVETAARERVTLMSIVGDAYARPMVDALEHRSVDLSSLQVLGTGGAITSEENKRALLNLIPHVTIRDGYGSSETGGMAYGSSTTGSLAVSFVPSSGAVVLSDDKSRILEPGDEGLGWTARRGRVPLGYLGDREKTEATFPILAGVRMAVPGDRARIEPDGSIRMLGRDSMVINTGGEKVFVEEVEEVLRSHPDVDDALVVGRPSERFGQEVVAVVQLRPGASVRAHDVREFAAVSLARFKAPRSVVFCATIQRQASGKPDYQWALRTAVSAVDATL
jgi:3-oxocholest-4-en-26-oate---CoA ligase